MIESKQWWLLLVGLVVSLQLSAEEQRDPHEAYELGYYTVVEEQMRQRLSKDPEDYASLYNLGATLYRLDRFPEAAEQFRLAADATEDLVAKAKSKLAQGNALARGSQLEKAVETYRQGLSFDLENKALAENLRWAEELLKQQQDQQQQSEQNQQQQDQQQSEQNQQQQDQQQQSEQNQQQQDQQQQSEQNQQQQDQQQQSEQSQQQQSEQSQQQQSDQSQQQQSEQSQQQQSEQSQQQQAEQDQKEEQSKNEQQSSESSEEQSAKDQQSAGVGRENQDPDKQGEEPTVQPQGSPEAEDIPEGDVATMNQQSGSSDQTPQTLTPRQLRLQEAEKVLRSVEDQISKYMLRPTEEQMRDRPRSNKDW